MSLVLHGINYTKINKKLKSVTETNFYHQVITYFKRTYNIDSILQITPTANYNWPNAQYTGRPLLSMVN